MVEANFTAIIPVRKGSRRLKNKNILPFNDTNLLINKILQLKQVPLINRIVVSSDSELMLEMALKNNVFIHKRNKEYCDEKTKNFGEVVKHICENVVGENIIWATCTSPLVLPKHYIKAIGLYKTFVLNEKRFDSLMSVEPFKRYLWNENGPLNYKLGLGHVPSQMLEQLYFVTDGILIAPRKKMIEWSYFHGKNPIKFILDKKSSIDIDDALDLVCAKAWNEDDIK